MVDTLRLDELFGRPGDVEFDGLVPLTAVVPFIDVPFTGIVAARSDTAAFATWISAVARRCDRLCPMRE